MAEKIVIGTATRIVITTEEASTTTTEAAIRGIISMAITVSTNATIIMDGAVRRDSDSMAGTATKITAACFASRKKVPDFHHLLVGVLSGPREENGKKREEYRL